jgi:hypothetical protein
LTPSNRGRKASHDATPLSDEEGEGTMTRIERLKAKARKAYLAAEAIRNEYPCGHELARHISGPLAKQENKFREAMAELRRIDPNCPVEVTP